jgi:glutamine amidotransferase
VIALIDYGAGNLASVRKALSAVGAEVWTPAVPGELGRAHGIIVPGVGHFAATRALTDEWRTAIKTMAGEGTPLLGICVGMQWLFEGSSEAPDVPGLSVFYGTCTHFTERFDEADRDVAPLKVPHVGWNSLALRKRSRLMEGIAPGTQVYFTHSYAAPIQADCVAACEYGVPFSAAAERDNVAAVQFHPEKSGEAGLRILRNWVAQVKGA